MKQIDTLLLSKWIVPIEPHNTVFTDHAIAIDQGKILAILPHQVARENYQAKETLNLPNHVLMPGLINTHTHSPMTLFRGLADDRELTEWLHKHIWPAEAELLSDSFVREGSEIAIAEMIKSGTTCFNEHYFYPEIIADCVKDSGIRGMIGMIVINVPTRYAQNADSCLSNALKILEHPSPSERVTWCWAPHSPYTLSNQTLMTIHEHSKAHQLKVHIHMHETKTEIQSSLAEFKVRPLARFRQLGLLDEQLINVHMTQLTEEEIQWIAEAGSHVVHCPESNLKLASGFCPVQRLLDSHINVSLGTDGAASNNDLDMFSEMRTAALIGKMVANNPTATSALSILEMATINGAKALGLDHITGSLVVGKAADIIAVDFAQIQTQPCYQVISHLVYAINSQQVTDVWVDGKRLLNQRQLTTLDEKNIIKNALQWQSRLVSTKRVIVT